MSDTPMTDEVLMERDDDLRSTALGVLAKDLERNLAATTAQRDVYARNYDFAWSLGFDTGRLMADCVRPHPARRRHARLRGVPARRGGRRPRRAPGVTMRARYRQHRINQGAVK